MADGEDEQVEATRLRRAAKRGLVQSVGPGGLESPAQRVQTVLHARKMDGADLVKKQTSSGSKVLVAFPGCLKVALGATIGGLDRLNSKLPECTLDLGEGNGVLHLRGAVVHPRNAIFPVKIANKRGVPAPVITCGDPISSVLLFSEWWWDGSGPGEGSSFGEPLWEAIVPESSVHQHVASPQLLSTGMSEEKRLDIGQTTLDRFCPQKRGISEVDKSSGGDDLSPPADSTPKLSEDIIESVDPATPLWSAGTWEEGAQPRRPRGRKTLQTLDDSEEEGDEYSEDEEKPAARRSARKLGGVTEREKSEGSSNDSEGNDSGDDQHGSESSLGSVYCPT